MSGNDAISPEKFDLTQTEPNLPSVPTHLTPLTLNKPNTHCKVLPPFPPLSNLACSPPSPCHMRSTPV